MKASEYRYQIELIHHEITNDPEWLLTDNDFKLFVDLAMSGKSGNLVLENWRIFLSGIGCKTPIAYFEWWEINRPDNIELAKPEKKKSPFDEVRMVFK